ncbi:hypothetical protein PILCRDRAFT_823319 [Piloderma croceum F 1598]|uniref:Zn(2)-C6 fungal-type domain-containing protein n=1 Tax=Piloderma croceum (strain F 1598) TaxID=765440 RepID=A0A0C3BR18_PILCF|nr:hypothetical protein PILCRDRAFT_823319 [Piloderma croceum F 1598]
MESFPTNTTTSKDTSLPPKPNTPKPPPSAKSPRQKADQLNNSAAARPRPSGKSRSTPDQAQEFRIAPRGPPPPFPGSAYQSMNHNYSTNGSRFTQSGQHHPSGSYASQPSPSANGASGPGQYGYPIHHAPYPPTPHGFPTYPPYAPQMVMYGPPRTNAPPEPSRTPSAQSPVPSFAATITGKRKRKSIAEPSRGKGAGDLDSDQEGGGGSGSDRARVIPTQQSTTSAASADAKKRTKTQRACDSCRSRKIRCDILTDSEPPSCQHCKQYGFECTFFLPITETRFKKKKTEDGADNQDKTKSADTGRDTNSPHAEVKRDARVFGPTTTEHLLHSQATISSRIYESYDQRYHHTWEVTKTRDGLIQVEEPMTAEQPATLPKPVELRIDRDVVERLLNAYFTDIAPIFPVVTQAEFLASPSPPQILLYSMCLVAAARRDVPQSVFDSIRYAVNGVIKSEDVLSTATIVNVQALLILCMVGDCHSQFVPNALSALWIRLGTAIRMAQDLGLHRAESVKQNIELKRRLWGACVISDRWTSLTYGHPYMIDVQDCDARLPSSGDPNDLYMDELVRLSVLLGRVLKTIYSPSGLTFTTDAMLHGLLSDLETWKTNLPESLKYRGPETPRNAGLLHLLYSCVCMIFWRVFMRISYSCPDHLKFGLTVEQWSGLVQLTGESIDWLDTYERAYDVWLLVAYAATSCALVQYHTWARRKDAEAATKLRKLRDCVKRWEGSLSPDHMSARRKTAEIIALLYEATQGPPLPIDGPPALNPTGGVTGKQPPPVNGLQYKKDPSRQGSGVFIAHGATRKNYEDLLPGVLVSPSDSGSEAGSQTETGANTSTAAPSSSSMVNITPLGGDRAERSFPNMNPAMNSVMAAAPGNVQVMNVLDEPQASDTLEQFAMTDTGFLEGIPGGMFDWGQWDTFFSRFNASVADGGGGGGMLSGYRQQHQSSLQQQSQASQNAPGESYPPASNRTS